MNPYVHIAALRNCPPTTGDTRMLSDSGRPPSVVPVYRSFAISNFRSHRHLELESLGAVNLITGLNDAGKTSVMEALFLHATGSGAGLLAIRTIRTARGQEDYSFGGDGESPWLGLFNRFDLSSEISLDARMAIGRRRVSLKSPVTDADKSAPRGAGSNQLASSYVRVITQVNDERPVSYSQSMGISSTRPDGSMSVQLRSEPEIEPPFVPATLHKSGIIADELAVGFSDLRKRRMHGLLMEALQELDPRIEHLELLVTSGQPRLHAQIGENLVPFELLGDGPNAVARYLVEMGGAADGILLIDEIGAGVHHSVLPKMWRSLYRAARRLNVQLFATTHSQETVAAAYEAIRDNNALYVHRLRRGAGGEDATRVTTYFGPKLRNALDVNADLR